MNEEELKANLEKLSKCKGLKPSDLEGRYKKAYESLRVKIKQDAEKYLTEIATENLWFTELSQADDINAFIDSPDGQKIMKQISIALFKECDFDKYHELCMQMRVKVVEILLRG